MARKMERVLWVSPNQVKPNPFRNPKTPLLEKKIEVLTASIKKAKVWPSILVRPEPGTDVDLADRDKLYQAVFGHHRLETIRRLALDDVWGSEVKRIPVVVQEDLTDDQMLIYMANENAEEYGADFLINYYTWQAARKHIEKSVSLSTDKDTRKRREMYIAEFLGWLTVDKQKNRSANACAAMDKFLDDLVDARETYKEDVMLFSLNLLEGLSTNAVRSKLKELDQELNTSIAYLEEQRTRKKAKVDVKKKEKEPEPEIDPVEVDDEGEPQPRRSDDPSDVKPDVHRLYIKYGKRAAADIEEMLLTNKREETNLAYFTECHDELALFTSEERKVQKQLVEELKSLINRAQLLIKKFNTTDDHDKAADHLPEHRTMQ